MNLTNLVFLVLSALLALPGSEPGYVQTYAVVIKGNIAGTEKVSESSNKGGNIISTSEHELFVSDGLETKRMSFVTSMELSGKDGSPLSYRYQYTSGENRDFYDVRIKDGQATRVLNRNGHQSESTVAFSPDMVILDFNVYHQYDFLLRKYDFKKRGQQSFRNFLPLIGGEVSILLEYLGDGNLDTGRGTMPVRNFKISLLGVGNASFSVDKVGRLVRLLVPNQDLEVIRKDLLP